MWGYRPWKELSKAERPRAERSRDHRSLNAGVSVSDTGTPGNRAAKKAGCMYLFQLLFDLDVHSSVGMLDHGISASLGF